MDFRNFGMRISNFCWSGSLPKPCKLQKRRAVQIRISKSEFRNSRLSLRELEALAGALLPILLAFLDARVAGYESGLFQCRSQVCVVFKQRARNTVTNGAGLTGRSAAANINQNVKL